MDSAAIMPLEGIQRARVALIGWAWGVVSFFLLIVGFSDLLFVCLHECEHMWERVHL